MGQLFERISRLARAYWTDAKTGDVDWADRFIDEEDDELRREIDEATKSVSDEVHHAHKVLSIPLGSSANAVKSAFRKSMYQWHPDRFVGGTEREQAIARERAQEINAAYIILKTYYRF